MIQWRFDKEIPTYVLSSKHKAIAEQIERRDISFDDQILVQS